MINYIIEIRNRIFLLFITWVSIIFIGFLYKEILLFLFIKPALYNDLIKYPIFDYFIYTNISEIFTTFFQIILFISNQIFFIYFFYHVLVFISPGLYYFEHWYLKITFVFGIFFSIFSIFILNTFLLPISFQFFLNFQNSFKNKIINFYLEAKLIEYFYFYMNMYYTCIFSFQFFTVLIIFLEYINLNSSIVKNFRKFFYFIFVVFATLVTPPDIFSQIFLSLVVVFIYEFSVICIFLKIQIKKTNLVNNLNLSKYQQ